MDMIDLPANDLTPFTAMVLSFCVIGVTGFTETRHNYRSNTLPSARQNLI